MLPVQPPLTFKDFGGGITDNDIPGESNQYQKADNLDITKDLQLLQRDGSQILSSTEYQLPGGNHRVAKLVNFDSDSELLGLQGTKFYYRSAGSWTSLLGPTSGDPFTLNDYDTQDHHAEWQKHLFITSESGNKPIKFYRDGSSNPKLRTAGLPAFVATVTGWSDNGLADAITLINDLRTKMITHYNNSTASPTFPDTTYAHTTASALTTQYNNANGSVAASNLATLITLLNLLRTNLNTHLLDIIRGNTQTPAYHLTNSAGGTIANSEEQILNFVLKDPTLTIPSTYTILQIIPYLNDLRNKWNWHTFALDTHWNAYKNPHYPSATSVTTGFGVGATAYPKVSPTYTSPTTAHTNLQIAPNYSTLLQYIIDFKTEYDAHRNSKIHSANDTYNTVTSNVSSAPTTIEDAITLLAHIGYQFYRHYADANYDYRFLNTSRQVQPYTEYAVTASAGNSGLTSVTPDPTVFFAGYSFVAEPNVSLIVRNKVSTNWRFGNIIPMSTNFWTGHFSGSGSFIGPAYATATPSSSTITLSANANTVSGSLNVIFGASYFHYSLDTTATAISPFYIQSLLEAIDLDLDTTTALTAVGNAAKTLVTLLRTHTLDKHVLAPSITFGSFVDPYLYSTSGNRYSAYIYLPSDHTNEFSSHYNSELIPISGQFLGVTQFPLADFAQTRFDTAPTGASYNYQFLYRFDYTVGTVSYSDFSTPSATVNVLGYVSEDSVTVPDTWKYSNSFSQIPSLVNASGDNYDAANIFKEVYRTTNGGTVFYKVTAFANASSTTITVTIATPGVVTWTAHGFAGGEAVSFSTTGALPTGITAGTIYYVLAASIGVNTFRFSATAGGTAINTTGSQSGVHTAYTAYSSYSDTTRDTELVTKAAIYTTGGVANNDPPPIAKYIHILDNIAYYANVTESGVAAPYRLRQSIPDDIDSCPSDFLLDFDQAITGISSVKNNIVVACTNNIYRVSGFFDSFGRGGMTKEIISDTVGGVNHESMVKTDIGVFFAGQNGLFYTDGYQVLRISKHLEKTYLSYVQNTTQKSRIVGVHKKNERKILWTMQTTTGGSSADIIWSLDLSQGVKDQMPFTTWSGVSGFAPTALAYYNNQTIRGTLNGYVLKHDPTYYMDPKIDTAVAATSWTVQTVMWDFKTCNLNFGTTALRKYFTWIMPQFHQYTNLSAGISTDSDKGRITLDLTPIRSRKLADWGDANVATPSDFTAKNGSIIDEMRRFKSTGLKANYMAVELKNGYVVVTSSDVAGVCTTASLGGGLFSATLTVAGKKWPNYVVDYYLRISGVDYLVGVRTSDTIISCTGVPSFAAGTTWELWGYPKNERAHIIDLTVRYNLMGDKTKDYSGATSSDGGQNA